MSLHEVKLIHYTLDLRFSTRLDRDVTDIIWLLDTMISERVSPSQSLWAELLVNESNTRVRKALKLLAYIPVYLTLRT